MLILTRRTDESITIGNDIVIKIIAVKGGVVSIGIQAPKDVPIDREEIYLAKKYGGPDASDDSTQEILPKEE